MHRVPGDSMVPHPHHRLLVRSRIDGDRKKSPLEPEEFLHLLIARLGRIAVGMHVRRGAAAEFAGAADRVDRGILLVPITGDDNHAGLSPDEAPQFIPFGAKGVV